MKPRQDPNLSQQMLRMQQMTQPPPPQHTPKLHAEKEAQPLTQDPNNFTFEASIYLNFDIFVRSTCSVWRA